MSTEDNLAIVHRYLDEVVNTGNLDAARNLFADDHVAHYAGFPALHGHDDWKQLTSMSYTGFPDTYTTFEDEMAVGDKVVVRYIVRATHKGNFMNIPAIGKSVKYYSIVILRIPIVHIADMVPETA